MNDIHSTLEDYKFTPMMNPWREFVTEMWFKHKDETLMWTGKPLVEYGFADYFRKNKWFLKNKYKLTKRNQ